MRKLENALLLPVGMIARLLGLVFRPLTALDAGNLSLLVLAVLLFLYLKPYLPGIARHLLMVQ
ncbi:MAG: hypothetical protein HY814_02855 [Candidatus Riflebacteria bacterium]|nr:hypothetical protein [Candidatus Riflebacteria bacterium]